MLGLWVLLGGCVANQASAPHPPHHTPQVRPLRNTWEQGIREGTLRVPEGVPFIWNVFDHPLCHGTEARRAAGLAQHGAHAAHPVTMCSLLWAGRRT